MEIRLDGKRYNQNEIAQLLCCEQLGWRADLYRFLLEWWNDDAVINQQTSGSTGTPKLIPLQKLMMRRSAARTCRYFSLDADARLGLALSTNYIAGKMMVVRALEIGAELLTTEPSSQLAFKHDLDFLAIVPLQAESLCQQPLKVKNVLLGGAAVSASLRQKIVAESCSNFYLGYGMTESCSHVALQRLGSEETAYVAMDGVSFDTDDRGCLLLDDKILDLELQTNDLADVEDNQFFWRGRVDTIINSGGIKFSPEKLEDLLATKITCPFTISSYADNRLGKAIALVVESPSVCYLSQSKRDQRRQKLLQEIKNLLPVHALPRRLHYVRQLARTQNGKIDRRHNYFASTTGS